MNLFTKKQWTAKPAIYFSRLTDIGPGIYLAQSSTNMKKSEYFIRG